MNSANTPLRVTTQLLLLLALMLSASCAEVQVRKVDRHNDSSVCGFRYYLPRPAVAVKKPMPVAGDSYIVSGTMTKDRMNVQIPTKSLPEHLRSRFQISSDGNTLSIPASSVMDARSTAAEERTKNAGGGDAAAAPATEDDTKKKSATATLGSKDLGGTYGTLVENVGGPYFNITYLPDFSEKYAINFKAGLGRVGTGTDSLKLRHGWMLESISIDIDNTAIGEFVFSQVDKFTSFVDAFARAKTLPKPVSEAEEVQNTGSDERIQILLRITYVVEAQPGLYPILKPRECTQWCDLEKTLSLSGGVSSKDWLIVPILPLTVVAYNVRRAVSIEALSLTPTKKAAPSPVQLDKNGIAPWVTFLANIVLRDTSLVASVSKEELAQLGAEVAKLSSGRITPKGGEGDLLLLGAPKLGSSKPPFTNFRGTLTRVAEQIPRHKGTKVLSIKFPGN